MEQMLKRVLMVFLGASSFAVATGCGGFLDNAAAEVANVPARNTPIQLKVLRYKPNEAFQTGATARTQVSQYVPAKHVVSISGSSAFKGGYLHCDAPQATISTDLLIKVNATIENCSDDLGTYGHFTRPLTRVLWYCGAGKTVDCLLLSGFVHQGFGEINFRKQRILFYQILNDSLRLKGDGCPEPFISSRRFVYLGPRVNDQCDLVGQENDFRALVPLVGGACPKGWSLLGNQKAHGYCFLSASK